MKQGELEWRCRRGMRELDVLLTRWLEQHRDRLSGAELSAFQRLLDLPDPELARYLLAGAKSDDPELARVIDSVRGGTSGR